MPKYDPTIHDPITVDLQAFDFVQSLTDIDSPTFGNYYRSAISAGYKPSYARVIGQFFPKCRIKRIIKTMENPAAQAAIKRMREEPEDPSYPPPKRMQKRMRAEENRQFKEVEFELEAYRGLLNKRSM